MVEQRVSLPVSIERESILGTLEQLIPGQFVLVDVTVPNPKKLRDSTVTVLYFHPDVNRVVNVAKSLPGFKPKGDGAINYKILRVHTPIP